MIWDIILWCLHIKKILFHFCLYPELVSTAAWLPFSLPPAYSIAAPTDWKQWVFPGVYACCSTGMDSVTDFLCISFLQVALRPVGIFRAQELARIDADKKKQVLCRWSILLRALTMTEKAVIISWLPVVLVDVVATNSIIDKDQDIAFVQFCQPRTANFVTDSMHFQKVCGSLPMLSLKFMIPETTKKYIFWQTCYYVFDHHCNCCISQMSCGVVDTSVDLSIHLCNGKSTTVSCSAFDRYSRVHEVSCQKHCDNYDSDSRSLQRHTHNVTIIIDLEKPLWPLLRLHPRWVLTSPLCRGVVHACRILNSLLLVRKWVGIAIQCVLRLRVFELVHFIVQGIRGRLVHCSPIVSFCSFKGWRLLDAAPKWTHIWGLSTLCTQCTLNVHSLHPHWMRIE